ncbi:alpha/beta hydrolase [Hyphococcus sp.]|uniref:alpha/beta hydrolase n=1 Tax=Hyphococcus sp. TaxID=2038636 RepID=UPI003CCBD0AA
MSRFIEIDGNPVPPRAQAIEFAANDGAKLRGAFFPVENARGTAVLVTGWSEFIEKYFETVTDLHARKLNVAMMDWRGQGLSDRSSAERTKWSGYFNQITDDLRLFIESHVKARFPGPYILMTHSMGGMPALMLLASGYPAFECAVLCAPMTRLFPEPRNRITALAASLASNFGMARKPVTRGTDHADVFEGNIFTSDPGRHAIFRDLRLALGESANDAPTYGWVSAAMKASAAIHAPGALDGVQTPVLIISAGAEQQIDGGDHANIAAANPNIRQEIIDGALHEILMERNEIRAQYFSAFDAFIEPALNSRS